MRRRDFLGHMGAGAMVMPTRAAVAVTNVGSPPPFRLLYSNDLTNVFNCASPFHELGETYRPSMLEASVDEASAADAQLLQPGVGWTAWWQSKVDPPSAHAEWFHAQTGLEPPDWLKYLVAGGDFVSTFVARCRRRGVAPFVSLRMNDHHHLLQKPGWDLALVSRFYAEHPGYRVGAGQPTGRPSDGRTAALDWSFPIVREQKMRLIRELAETYDIDGLELDFMRYPSYFDVARTGSDERVAIMTGFVRSVRDLLDRTAKPAGHRYLSVRIPSFLGAYDMLGLDPAALFAVGADIFNISSNFYTEQQTDLGRIRDRIPHASLYLEMCQTTMLGPKLENGESKALRTTDEQYYTGAHLAYRRGAAGISLFNFAYYRRFGHDGPELGPFNEPPFHVLPHLKDPTWLSRQAQWYVLAPSYAPMGAKQALPEPMPPAAADGFRLDMALPDRKLTSGLVRLRATEAAGDGWAVDVNGAAAAPSRAVLKPLAHPYDAFLGTAEEYACFTFPPDRLHDGVNEFRVRHADGAERTIEYLDVVLT